MSAPVCAAPDPTFGYTSTVPFNPYSFQGASDDAGQTPTQVFSTALYQEPMQTPLERLEEEQPQSTTPAPYTDFYPPSGPP